MFCVINLIANKDKSNFEKSRFDFECLSILAPVLVRLVHDIYPGIDLYIAMLGTPRAGTFNIS